MWESEIWSQRCCWRAPFFTTSEHEHRRRRGWMLYLVLSNGYREVLSALVAMATAVAPSGRGGCLPEFGEDLLERSRGWNGSKVWAEPCGPALHPSANTPTSTLIQSEPILVRRGNHWWEDIKSLFSHFITQSEDVHSWPGQGAVHHVSLDIKWRGICCHCLIICRSLFS